MVVGPTAATDFEWEVELSTTLLHGLDNTSTAGYSQSSPGTDTMCDRCVHIANVVIGLLGVLGNLLVIVVLYRNKGTKSRVTNILIVNQSALDLVSASVQTVTNIVNLTYTMEYTFPGADFVCRLYHNPVFTWSALVGSTYNLIVLNLDRYFQIVHPITHRIQFTPRRAKIVAVAVWFVGPTINMYTFFTSGVRGDRCILNSFWPEPWVSKMVGFVKLTFQFFLPVFVMFFAYVRMIIAIRRRSSVLPCPALDTSAPPANAAQSAANLAKQRKNASIQRNIFKTMVIVTVCFVLCWSWNQVFILLYYLDYPLAFNSEFYRFSVFMVLLNCSCNPVIYTFSYEQFRRGLKALIM